MDEALLIFFEPLLHASGRREEARASQEGQKRLMRILNRGSRKRQETRDQIAGMEERSGRPERIRDSSERVDGARGLAKARAMDGVLSRGARVNEAAMGAVFRLATNPGDAGGDIASELFFFLTTGGNASARKGGTGMADRWKRYEGRSQLEGHGAEVFRRRRRMPGRRAS